MANNTVRRYRRPGRSVLSPFVSCRLSALYVHRPAPCTVQIIARNANVQHSIATSLPLHEAAGTREEADDRAQTKKTLPKTSTADLLPAPPHLDAAQRSGTPPSHAPLAIAFAISRSTFPRDRHRRRLPSSRLLRCVYLSPHRKASSSP